MRKLARIPFSESFKHLALSQGAIAVRRHLRAHVFSPGRIHFLVIWYVLFKLIWCNCFLFCFLSTARFLAPWLLFIGVLKPGDLTSFPLGELPKCYTKRWYFAPGKGRQEIGMSVQTVDASGVGQGSLRARQDAGPSMQGGVPEGSSGGG